MIRRLWQKLMGCKDQLFQRGSIQPGRARPYARPCVELLESRQLLAVSITPLTDPSSGADRLVVRTDGVDDTVTITDSSTDKTTTIVANGETMTFDHQFALFDLELMSQKDTVTLNLDGAVDARRADVMVSLGKGENHFGFNPDLTAITNHSDVNLNIRGHNGNDFVDLNFGDILESRVNVQASNLGGSLGGSATLANAANIRDSITFGALRAGIRNSSVDVNVGLGHGNTNFAFNYGSDLGHLAPADGADPAASDFGPSTFNVNITGSNRASDVDNVTLFANGEVNTGSTLNFNVQFLAGNDTFKGTIDAANFQIDDDGGQFISDAHLGGAAHFNIHDGAGNDTVSFKSINQDHTIELSGMLDINVLGGSGNDTTKIDLGGAGFTDDDPFELLATNRAFRLRVDGGEGDNIIKVNVANAATATFDYDIAIFGGDQNNDITFVGTNPSGGTPTFGPSGSVFIDGGFGGNNQVDVFGNFPVEVMDGQ
jgi:hypothetical protein